MMVNPSSGTSAVAATATATAASISAIDELPPDVTSLVFLDVDGVLNSEASYGVDAPLEDALMHRLATIIERTGAFIAISSTWRLREDHREKLIALAEGYFGIARSRFIGSTPEIRHADVIDASSGYVDYATTGILSRIDEIKAFMAAKRVAERGIRWVVIDDMDMGSHDAEIAVHFVKTKREEGLTDAAVELAVHLLGE